MPSVEAIRQLFNCWKRGRERQRRGEEVEYARHLDALELQQGMAKRKEKRATRPIYASGSVLDMWRCSLVDRRESGSAPHATRPAIALHNHVTEH